MKKPPKNASKELYKIAAIQNGFFTTKQAIKAGFSSQTQLYHVRSGNWIREHRGVYRLATFPVSHRPDLIRWWLWSRNRQDVPEGIYSHETALSLHDLSDTMPAKLHMTVPNHFRRNSKVPRVLILHHANLPASDIETLEGVPITKPLRTIIDLEMEGRISKDILTQALKEGMRRGLVIISALDKASFPQETRKKLKQLLKG